MTMEQWFEFIFIALIYVGFIVYLIINRKK